MMRGIAPSMLAAIGGLDRDAAVGDLLLLFEHQAVVEALRAQAFLSQAAVVEQPAPPLPPAIDRAIDEVVQRALIKDPAQRLPSPAALREALLA
jgi:hypothetical protein